MKTTNTIFRIAASMFAIAAMLFISGCAKDEDSVGAVPNNPPSELITDREEIREFEAQMEHIPTIAWYNTTMDQYIVVEPNRDPSKNGFSEPGEINFVSPSDVAAGIEGLYLSTVILFSEPGAFEVAGGGSSGRGVLVTSETSHSLDYVMMLQNSEESSGSADDENDVPSGLYGLGGQGTPNNYGTREAIGISGNIAKLLTHNFQSTAEVYQFLNAVVFIVIYTQAVVGNYALLNWFDYLYQSTDYLHGKSFVWAYTFTAASFALYFSQLGNIIASANGMAFTGQFYSASTPSPESEELDQSNKGIEFSKNNSVFGELSTR